MNSAAVAPSDRILDRLCVIVPAAACLFAVVVSHLFTLMSDDATARRPENRVVWPLLATVAVALALRNSSRLRGSSLGPPIGALVGYLALAGASVWWAFDPELAFTRFIQQLMIVTSIVLPPMVGGRTADRMRALFLCLAFASILNLLFVIGRPQPLGMSGHPGYFSGKNYLGELAAITLIFSLYEATWPGARRAVALVMILLSTFLLAVSHGKAALGLAVIAPALAALVVAVTVSTRISAAIVLLYAAALATTCYGLFSEVFDVNFDDVSQVLFGDPSFTGRTTIWAFALDMIQQRPFLGWGYQSFWMVGRDAPSVLEAPGWVAQMPHAHNGYLDALLQTGPAGLVLLSLFILATVHAIGRTAERAPLPAWLALALALFIILTNVLETTWAWNYDPLWIVFLALVSETSAAQGPAGTLHSPAVDPFPPQKFSGLASALPINANLITSRRASAWRSD